MVISIDVVSIGDGPLSQRQVHPGGRELWQVLYQAANGLVVMIVDGADTQNMELIERWLHVNAINGLASVLYGDMAKNPERRIDLMRECRINGPVSMYVDTDPETCLLALREGVDVMLYGSPKYLRPEWRPDAEGGYRPWAEIADELRVEPEGAQA